jgi:pimeloyl-ACP methyl ester carboxylesterase
VLAGFGSYFCGGGVLEVSDRPPLRVPVTREVTLEVDENGLHAVGHAYVQFFVPAARNREPPVVLVHGGGLCGTVWETTPDGRPGWLQRLLHHGFEVHVVDSVERGRAGWSPHAVGHAPPVTRSLEDAWTLFRLGPPSGYGSREGFAGQLFPVAHLPALGRFLVPRWTSQGDAQVSALAAVLGRVGRCHLVAHSQGCETAFGAATAVPQAIASLLAIEPSAAPAVDAPWAEAPFALVRGDFLDTADLWRQAVARWDRTLDLRAARGLPTRRIDLPELAPGSSHLPMHDANSDAVLDLLQEQALRCG